MKKKKLKKELKRFISDKIIDVSFINLEPLKNEHNDYYYDLKVYVEKELSKDALLEKANRDYDFGYIVKCMSDGKEKVINSINPVFCSNGIWLNEDVFIYKNGKWAEVLKKPVIKVQDKWLYEGDEYWLVEMARNWKLQKIIIAGANSTLVEREETEKFKRFLTKRAALDYVLVDANKRFNGKYFEQFGHEGIHQFKCAEIANKKTSDLNQNWIYETENKRIIWKPKKGFIAKPIKETPLMLGEHEVKIDYLCDSDGVPCDEINITANGGQVTKEEWMEWQEIFILAAKKPLNIQIELNKYTTTYYKNGKHYISIGCIKDVTIRQIQAITDKLNEL